MEDGARRGHGVGGVEPAARLDGAQGHGVVARGHDPVSLLGRVLDIELVDPAVPQDVVVAHLDRPAVRLDDGGPAAEGVRYDSLHDLRVEADEGRGGAEGHGVHHYRRPPDLLHYAPQGHRVEGDVIPLQLPLLEGDALVVDYSSPLRELGLVEQDGLLVQGEDEVDLVSLGVDLPVRGA